MEYSFTNNTKIENFKGLKVDIEYKDILEEYAKKTVSILHTPTWKSQIVDYNQGWEIKEHPKKQSDSAVVWNRPHYRLTHLLEKGHLITNKKNGVGWASPHPHIDPAFQSVKGPFERAMQDAKIKVK